MFELHQRVLVLEDIVGFSMLYVPVQSVAGHKNNYKHVSKTCASLFTKLKQAFRCTLPVMQKCFLLHFGEILYV